MSCPMAPKPVITNEHSASKLSYPFSCDPEAGVLRMIGNLQDTISITIAMYTYMIKPPWQSGAHQGPCWFKDCGYLSDHFIRLK